MSPAFRSTNSGKRNGGANIRRKRHRVVRGIRVDLIGLLDVHEPGNGPDASWRIIEGLAPIRDCLHSGAQPMSRKTPLSEFVFLVYLKEAYVHKTIPTS